MLKKTKTSPELYLCEKPSQGRDIARVLGAKQKNQGYFKGDQVIVSWCIGHLLEMLPPDGYDAKFKRWCFDDLPIIPKDWKLVGKKSTRQQLAVLKKLLKNTRRVIIATDADREGETIAREVLHYLKFKGSVQRLWLSALDPVSIRRALNSIRPNQETEPLYYSGLARSRADWLIGMNLTRAFTLQGHDRQVRSVGRVQTPTLALIVKRDREISQFKSKPFYEVSAFFNSNPGNDQKHLQTTWLIPENILQEKKYCLHKSLAQAVIDRCNQQYGQVETASTQRKKQPPPLPYNLSSLQQEASRRWGYGAQEVLNLAQSLYENHKLTTYPRSDCEYLPMSQFNDAEQIMQALLQNEPKLGNIIAQANLRICSRVWNDKKITAHHAIIPTQATPGIAKLNHKEHNIYDLIRRRYIAQFFPDYEYDQSVIIIAIKHDRFKASGRIPRLIAWKQVFESSHNRHLNSNARSQKEEENIAQELPQLEKGEKLFCAHLKLIEKQTKPPNYYTEGTLIKAMESIGSQVTDKVMQKVLRETAGLGTQATRANIIQTLFQRKFIVQEKKVLKATALGFNLIDAVPQAIKDPVLTAQWEQQLDDIANNKGLNVERFLQQQIRLLHTILTQLKTAIPASPKSKPNSLPEPKLSPLKQYQIDDDCPECGHRLELRTAIRGYRIGQKYIGCSHFPNCRFYFWPPS